MIFKPMKTEDVLKALEGQENVLKPAVEAHERYFAKLRCHRCGSAVHPILNPKQLFREGSILPNYLAECSSCKCQFEPYTLIEVKLPSPPDEEVPLVSVPGEVDLFSGGSGGNS
jgi:hypothetical protein